MDALKELKEKFQKQTDEFAGFKEKNKGLAAKLAAAELQNLALEKKAREAEFAAFADGLPEQITPAMKQPVIDLCHVLHGAEVYEFSDGASKAKRPPVEVFREFLAKLPKAVEFSTIAEKGRAAKSTQGATAGEKINEFVQKKMSENDKLEYTAALDIVQREHPDLAKEYAASLS